MLNLRPERVFDSKKAMQDGWVIHQAELDGTLQMNQCVLEFCWNCITYKVTYLKFYHKAYRFRCLER